MYRYSLLSILYIAFVSQIVAQANYFYYHNIINEAEHQITIEKFDHSLQLYDSAFAQFDFAFTRDYVIAAQIAALEKDESRCIHYIKMAMKNGYKLYCLQNLKVLEQFIGDQYWEILSNEKDELRREYLGRIDNKLLMEWTKRYFMEQEYKNSDISDEVFENNYSRIVELLDSMPFVSTRIAGIDDKSLVPSYYSENGISKLSDCSCNNSRVITTLTHIDNPFKNIPLARYFQAIELGHLHPRNFALVYAYTHDKYIDNQFGRLPKVDAPLLPEFRLNYLYEHRYKDIEAVNEDRELIGLCPIETDLKKLEIERKYSIRMHFWYLRKPLKSKLN